VLIYFTEEASFLPRHLKFFWIGLLIYAASFVLIATGPSLGRDGFDGRLPGAFCAFYAFWLPLDFARDALFNNVPMDMGPVPYLSLLLSGWVNPVFLVAAFLQLTEKHPRLCRILKIAVVTMIPFTWVFFATFPMFYPREGHVLWVTGMLVALFSERLAKLQNLRTAD
jgi:hypothetical protein